MTPKLASDLTPAAYRSIFQKYGRLHIPGILETPSAVDLEGRLRSFDAWTRAVTVHYDTQQHPLLSPDVLTAEKVVAVERVVTPPAQNNIEFLFDMHSVATVRHKNVKRDPRLAFLGDFINGPAFLDFARALTGDARIQHCDASVTRYLPGHHLTPHNDANFGENRLYAYVLNLSRGWQLAWGGVLVFVDRDGHIAEGYTPAFNSLNVFKVPQQHAVTMVNSLAQGPRLAVTGWMHGPSPN